MKAAEVEQQRFMAEPLTQLSVLKESNEIVHKMEVMGLELQANLCEQVEALEGNPPFKVERWITGKVSLWTLD